MSLTATGANPVVLSVKLDGTEVMRFSDSASARKLSGKAGMLDYNGARQPIDRFQITRP